MFLRLLLSYKQKVVSAHTKFGILFEGDCKVVIIIAPRQNACESVGVSSFSQRARRVKGDESRENAEHHYKTANASPLAIFSAA